MSNLLYGSGNISRQEIALLDTPEASTKTHHPVPFSDYIGLVSDSLTAADVVIKEEEYQLTHGNQRLFGAMRIAPANEESFLPGQGTDLVLGLRGSHDRIIPRGLCIGTRVIVCSNLLFEGNLLNLKTRQTTNILDRLQPMIDKVVGQIGIAASANMARINRYKDFDLKTSQAGDALLVELYRQKALNNSQFGIAVDQWVEPDFIEHKAEGDWTVWNLMNAITQAYKPVGARAGHSFNHDTMATQATKMLEVLDQHVGLELA